MIVHCAVYRGGRRQQAEAMSLAEAARQRDTGAFIWVGTFDPTPAELAEIRDTFGLHDLAVEDAKEVPPPAEGRAVRRRGTAGHPAHRAVRRRARGDRLR